MARIAGVDIPNEKRVVISLTYIYGIGPTRASKILKEANISEDIRVKDLTEEQLSNIENLLNTSFIIIEKPTKEDIEFFSNQAGINFIKKARIVRAYFQMEQVSRFELPSQPWQGRILTTVLYLHHVNIYYQIKKQIARNILLCYNVT